MRLFYDDIAAFLVLFVFALLPMPAQATDDALSTAANQAFIAGNAKMNGVISRPSGLQIRILKNGVGKRPGATDDVQVYYSVQLINGTIIDGTSPGLPASIMVSSVIAGLREALLIMHEGDHWQLVLPPNLALGAHVTSDTIPPNQALVFDLTLVSTSPAPKTESENTNPLSIISVGHEPGAMWTIHP
jgi:FKBP-type peptidyl-prolyl cis-trans isomerase